MKADRGTRIALHGAEVLYSLALLAWLALPHFLELPGLDPLVRFPFPPPSLLDPAAAVLYLLPVLCLYKIAASFLGSAVPGLADPRRTFPVLISLASSALAIAALLLVVVPAARSWSYFRGLSPVPMAVFGLSLAHNACFLALLILRLNRRDESYREYLEFRRGGAGKARVFLEAMLAQGIQKRLVLSFTALVAVILAVLSFVLLGNFSRTILSAVIDNGQTLVERTASVIRANFGDDIAVDDYFRIETQKNSDATFRFNQLTFFRREAKGGEFTAAAGTEPAQLGSRLSGEGFALERTEHRFVAARQVYEFRAPVLIRGILVGFVQVDYSRETIFEPYFRTQLKVILVAALFLYATIFLVYVVARGIAFPILYLRMSVAAIAATLAGMIKGKIRISPELLEYKDRVRTRDEIKKLSGEIGNMTTVIRGVIPYISASTLKHSERAKPATERRELAFLFTDVRGFTSLCESLAPEKVEELLNRYLDLQSTVILANGGDIDKFVGDAIMAVFEGGRRELAACRTAMAIRGVMAREKEEARAGGVEALDIGIGIHSGPVVFGSFGAKDRMDFTSIGDTVNLASRLEAANKDYGTKTLLTGAVHAKVREQFLCREIDVITVKGKRQPVRIYELLQEQKSASDKLREIKKVFEGGLALYRKQRWEEAQQAFAFLASKHQDEASRVFLPRVAHFRKNPPAADWVGVFQLTTK